MRTISRSSRIGDKVVTINLDIINGSKRFRLHWNPAPPEELKPEETAQFLALRRSVLREFHTERRT